MGLIGDDNMTLGEIIKERRKELGISQDQLALALGLNSRSSVSKIEKNYTIANYEQLKIIMKMLKLKPNQLFMKEDITISSNQINTKYGEVRVIENEDNSITVTYNTEKNVLVDMRSSNQVKFIAVEPYTNKILTK